MGRRDDNPPPVGRRPDPRVGSDQGGGISPGGDYPLPRATAEILREGISCDNPSLALNRLVGPWDRSGGQWEPPTKENRKQFLQWVADMLKADSPACTVLSDALRRQEALFSTFGQQGWHVRRLQEASAWRTITGLGGANPLEISLTLHHIHGYPYLPSSGLKGATLAHTRTDGSVDLEAAFGTPEHSGGLVFFDALPEPPKRGKSLLELDVVNPHYGKYYRGEAPPADYLSPVPVTFLTIAPGTRFRFAIAARDAPLADQAVGWLSSTLTEAGVGGKTSAGYGVFEEVR